MTMPGASFRSTSYVTDYSQSQFFFYHTVHYLDDTLDLFIRITEVELV